MQSEADKQSRKRGRKKGTNEKFRNKVHNLKQTKPEKHKRQGMNVQGTIWGNFTRALRIGTSMYKGKVARSGEMFSAGGGKRHWVEVYIGDNTEQRKTEHT